MTFAKYTTEFIPEPDLTPSTFTNYLTFLGNNNLDLAVTPNINFTSYQNNPIVTTNNLMPI